MIIVCSEIRLSAPNVTLFSKYHPSEVPPHNFSACDATGFPGPNIFAYMAFSVGDKSAIDDDPGGAGANPRPKLSPAPKDGGAFQTLSIVKPLNAIATGWETQPGGAVNVGVSLGTVAGTGEAATPRAGRP